MSDPKLDSCPLACVDLYFVKEVAYRCLRCLASLLSSLQELIKRNLHRYLWISSVRLEEPYRMRKPMVPLAFCSDLSHIHTIFCLDADRLSLRIIAIARMTLDKEREKQPYPSDAIHMTAQVTSLTVSTELFITGLASNLMAVLQHKPVLDYGLLVFATLSSFNLFITQIVYKLD